MAGDWMKIELELPDKPEVHYIAGVLNIDPDLVVGKLIRVWQWFNKHTTDGNAVGVTFALVDRLTSVTGFGEAMHFSGWLEHKGKSLIMPKFDRHTSESAKKRALTAQRQSRHRNAEVTQSALQREEKRREEKITTSASIDKPINAEAKSKLASISPNGSGWSGVTSNDLELWRAAYPAVDIATELLAAFAWTQANPANRKSNYRRFLTNWLKRAQDRAKPSGTGRADPWAGVA